MGGHTTVSVPVRSARFGEISAGFPRPARQYARIDRSALFLLCDSPAPLLAPLLLFRVTSPLSAAFGGLDSGVYVMLTERRPLSDRRNFCGRQGVSAV